MFSDELRFSLQLRSTSKLEAYLEVETYCPRSERPAPRSIDDEKCGLVHCSKGFGMGIFLRPFPN